MINNNNNNNKSGCKKSCGVLILYNIYVVFAMATLATARHLRKELILLELE